MQEGQAYELTLLTQRETATVCAVRRTTIRRRKTGVLRGAAQDSALKGWLIPVDDLPTAGLRLHAATPPDETAFPGLPGPEDRSVAAEPDVSALRAELEHLRHAHALAMVEAQHLREQLAVRREQLVERGEHIVDL